MINLDLAYTYLALSHTGMYAIFPNGYIIPSLALGTL